MPDNQELLEESGRSLALVMMAQEDNIDAIKRIANCYKQELGFVNRTALLTAVQEHRLLVVWANHQIIGFCHFYRRRDGWYTIYEIAVSPDWRRRGIGGLLINNVHTLSTMGIRLKCTKENDANKFYASIGLQQVREEMGKKRPLLVWEKETIR